ncbi:DUF4870 domain-containing protein [Halosimplex litoreum]|uniref:DUF4870 domain-containing protein n=1 Tax=Halosimplex litoreum TaxID=1198301 RepID=A0A7T3FVI9_9EURY|nr:DUF4870 domain-containing protein [Halosimplex litoreum]QPV61504.1 DUF4870 domain-containing protein [Halosimplex litoreum]
MTSDESTEANGSDETGEAIEGQSTSGQSTGGHSSVQTGGQAGGQASGHSAGPAANEPNTEMTGPAAGGTDLEPNVAAAIAYLFAPLTGIVMLLLEGDEDDFVRFHSLQSIGFGAVAVATWVAIGVVMGILTVIPFVGDIFAVLVLPLNAVVGLGLFAVWLLLILRAYQGERYGLPVLGPIAASD